MQKFSQIIPILPPSASLFASYQIAWEFRQEVASRQALADHCQWYRQAAAAHQQELVKLKQDINLMGWFNSSKYNFRK